MPKGRLGHWHSTPLSLRQRYGRIPGNLPQRQNHPLPSKQPPLLIQIRRTIRHLLRQRLIPRRRTPHRRADVTIAQLQPIILPHARRLIRIPRPMQPRIQKIPRPIPGKNPPSPIPPMRRRRESNDPKCRLRISKTSNRPPPILPIHVRTSLLLRHLATILA